jgi:magnesium transporter
MHPVITAYCSNCQAIDLGDLSQAPALRDDVVWIDMIEPTHEEEAYVEKALGIEVPTRDDLKDIEPSARLYTEDDAVFMTASLVWKAETDTPVLTDVAFILAGKRLITIRYAQPKSFALFIAALHRVPAQWRNGASLLAKLFETIIDRTAEILEISVARIDILSMHVFGERARKVRKPVELPRGKAARHRRPSAPCQQGARQPGSMSRLMTFFYNDACVQQDRGTKELCRTFRAISSRSASIRPISPATSPSFLMPRLV